MMSRVIMVLGIFFLLSILTGLSLRTLFPNAWKRFARYLFFLMLFTGTAGIAGWMVGDLLQVPILKQLGITASAAVLVASVLTAVTLPFWGSLGWWGKRKQSTETSKNISRRHFLTKTAGVVPALTGLTGPVGTLNSMQEPILRTLQISSPHLPIALDGLKILQLTDIHLGTFIDERQVEMVIEKARPYAPDLIALTGDLADDYQKLPGALQAINSLQTPLGVYACIGNHEIYRGRQEAERLLKEAGVQYLSGEGKILTYRGTQLFIGGADDPARMGQDHSAFLEKTVAEAFANCPPEVACKILLSHRPEAFEAAAQRKVTLTLSGHTHGAQVAFFGRSLFEKLMPRSYLLGVYQKGESRLYTSAGLGHWFPFRVNCPCEAALVTIKTSEEKSM